MALDDFNSLNVEDKNPIKSVYQRKCSQCPSVLSTRQSFYNHKKRHQLGIMRKTTIYPRKCQVCPEVLENKHAYYRHIPRCGKSPKGKTRCIFPDCRMYFYHRVRMVKHFQKAHPRMEGNPSTDKGKNSLQSSADYQQDSSSTNLGNLGQNSEHFEYYEKLYNKHKESPSNNQEILFIFQHREKDHHDVQLIEHVKIGHNSKLQLKQGRQKTQRELTHTKFSIIQNIANGWQNFDTTCQHQIIRLEMSTNIKAIWKTADAVCFDVDSTVIKEEGIDELAKFCGKSQDVLILTKKAMGGTMSFRESLSSRLNIIKPSLSQIQEFVRTHPPTLSKNIKPLVDALHRRGIPVYLISGGFRSIISPIALQLNIPLENVYANKMKFFFNGDFAGFDESELTSENKGKGAVIEILKGKFGYSNLVMIGDGATDLEACPPADAFIGYGGNAVREEVRCKAKWYIMDFQELIDELAHSSN